MSKPIDWSGWMNWFNSSHADISSDPSIPRYQWPWNDDDRDWVPDVLDTDIRWATHYDIVEGINGDLILDKALFKNDSPQGWDDDRKSESSWEQVGSNIFNKWTES